MSIKPLHSSIICVVLMSTFELTACSNEHKVLEANSQEDPSSSKEVSDADIDKDEDSSVAADSEAATAACDGETGVVVSGTVDFSGTLPETARLWLYWQEPTAGIPPCSMEITPVRFPTEFRFEQVPDKGWALVGFIDVDGGFPPIPAAGDFIVEIPPDELDLSNDLTDIALTISSTPKS